MSLAREVQERLGALGVRASKWRGQNFMTDEPALEAVAEAASKDAREAVVEIGPGLGFLTRKLLERNSQVFAVEKDRALAAFLREHFRGRALRLLEKDVLQIDLLRDFGLEKPSNVCGNIPYNITSPILEWLVGQRRLVRRAVLTVQLEVAHRLSARPGNKNWGALSIFIQTHASVNLLRRVGRTSFSPAPKVDSAVIEIDFVKQTGFPARDRDLFFKIVRRAFQKRRKTILNALEDSNDPAFSKTRLNECFHACGLDPRRRPETFTISEWAELSDALSNSLRPLRQGAIL